MIADGNGGGISVFVSEAEPHMGFNEILRRAVAVGIHESEISLSRCETSLR